MRQPVQMIDTAQDLSRCCQAWRELGRFAFDTEFIRDETYDARLCLIQVADANGVTLIDPAEGLDTTPFWELVLDPSIRVIVHAGKEDFDLCVRLTGKPPRNVFDVQVAAGFVGVGYPMSLVRLVAALTNHRIAKGSTLTDWMRRPLTDDQLRYAVEDVSYLLEMADKLEGMLGSLNRAAWAAEEMLRLEDAEHYRPPVAERLHKFRGMKGLDSLGLAVLQRLIEWRDKWAQEKNRPIRAMMRDDILVEIARRRPTKAQQLEVLRGFPQAKNPRVIQQILDLVAETAKSPKSSWPQVEQVREESPMERAAVDLLAGYLRATCDIEKMEYELVGGAQRLRDMLDFLRGGTSERPIVLTGWREQFAGARLRALLEGRAQVRLVGWPDDLRLSTA